MPIQQDLTTYQESISAELHATQNRVRNLIGDQHWLTDGEHKEAVLRTVLRSRLPESVHIGKGFVCFPSQVRHTKKSSRQLDVLISSKSKPTLYKDGELVFVTADAVEAVIEVKTTLRSNASASDRNNSDRNNLQSVLTRLANEVQFIRQNAKPKRCWAGLFVFERGNIQHENLLTALQSAADNDEERAIDCVTVGGDTFVHYWSRGTVQVESPIDGPVWHLKCTPKAGHNR